MNIIKTKKTFIKKEKALILKDVLKMIKKFGKNFARLLSRNKDTNYINRKIHHFFKNPFIFVNAYTKTSKN